MKQLTTIVIGIFLFTTTYANDTSLFNALQYKEVGFAIFKLETGNGTSKLYRKYNNMFGFKVNNRKLHNGKTKSNYAKYESRNVSLMDYYLFEKQLIKRFGIKNQREYIRVISKRYARNPSYGKLLRKQLKS
jgi:hypothetical protein